MKSYKADFILIFITLIWSSTFAIIKDVLYVITPFFFLILRFGTAALLFIMLFNKNIRIRQGKTLKYGIILGILYGAEFCLQIFALQYTTASKSAFITGTAVIWAPVFQMITEKKLLNIWQIIGVIIAGAGLYILSSPEGGSINIGDLLTLISAIILGAYIVYLGIYSKKGDINGLVLLQFIMAVIMSIPLAFFFEPFPLLLDANIIYTVLYTSIFATIVCSYLQTKYQKETTATRAAIIFLFEPIFAAFIAYFIFVETIGKNVFIGGALILLGLLFSELSDYFFKLNERFNYDKQRKSI